ncbi:MULTISPECIES: dUTP diphosphatase [Pseudomonas]|uniref:dUTP diphosphatase n=1 Tax=Pseudomonas lutea TaxID=243924 RepID=A0A9X8QLS0_9PSED|nr:MULTISPECIES: dUTP diphosphatase [Pseudomonas]SER37301.1 dUTP pyrophosphatase [Pseudomonas lutea]
MITKARARDWREMNRFNVCRIGEHDLPVPAQETAGAAGFDLRAVQGGRIEPGQRLNIPTGFAWEFPPHLCGEIWPRSGLAHKHGIGIHAGLIDNDYQGEVIAILHNTGSEPFTFEAGDRIAQMKLAPCISGTCVEVVAFGEETARGDKGFNSTGSK